MIFNKKTLESRADFFLSTQSGLSPVPRPTGEKRILLVEDEALASYMAASILKQLGYEVDCASAGKQALMLAKEHSYVLILMDLGLPDIDGLDVTKQIRLYESGVTKELPVPIVALTAHEDPIKKLHCLEAGVNNVLKKPLTKENAQDILETFVIERAAENDILDDTSVHFTAVSGKVIDVSKLMDLIEYSSDHAHVRRLIDKLMDDFPLEIHQLEQAHQRGDWRQVSQVTLRIAGKSAYCSMERLKAACTQLIDYLGLGYHELAESMYRAILNEIHLVLQEYAKLKSAGIL